MVLDTSDLAIGLAFGLFAGGVYFVGLAWSIGRALTTTQPGKTLIISAALRIALLLAAGWAVAQIGITALMGFALGFLLARMVAIALARTEPGKAAKWN